MVTRSSRSRRVFQRRGQLEQEAGQWSADEGLDPGQLDTEQVELLPPGSVPNEFLAPENDPDGGRRDRRVDTDGYPIAPVVIDGEVTSEIPAITDDMDAESARTWLPPTPRWRPGPDGAPAEETERSGGTLDHPEPLYMESGREPEKEQSELPEPQRPEVYQPEPDQADTYQTEVLQEADLEPERPPGPDPGPADTAGPTPERSASPPRRRRRTSGITRPPIGGRAEWRRQIREIQRLRLITLGFITLVLLGALPGFLLIREFTRDPAYRALDALDLPEGATVEVTDEALGSRLCVGECRIRSRIYHSERDATTTAEAFTSALVEEGWERWEVTGCPPADIIGGFYTCWRLDEYTLDLWVYQPDCEASEPAPGPVNVSPSPTPSASPRACPAAVATIWVRNALDDERWNSGE